jgi:hypothetical protein
MELQLIGIVARQNCNFLVCFNSLDEAIGSGRLPPAVNFIRVLAREDLASQRDAGGTADILRAIRAMEKRRSTPCFLY